MTSLTFIWSRYNSNAILLFNQRYNALGLVFYSFPARPRVRCLYERMDEEGKKTKEWEESKSGNGLTWKLIGKQEIKFSPFSRSRICGYVHWLMDNRGNLLRILGSAYYSKWEREGWFSSYDRNHLRKPVGNKIHQPTDNFYLGSRDNDDHYGLWMALVSFRLSWDVIEYHFCFLFIYVISHSDNQYFSLQVVPASCTAVWIGHKVVHSSRHIFQNIIHRIWIVYFTHSPVELMKSSSWLFMTSIFVRTVKGKMRSLNVLRSVI